MAHLIAKKLLVNDVIKLIVENYYLTLIESRNRFFESDIIDMLDDDEIGLYAYSVII